MPYLFAAPLDGVFNRRRETLQRAVRHLCIHRIALRVVGLGQMRNNHLYKSQVEKVQAFQ